MEWWRDGKFGMFIHWGLYAIPGRRVEGHRRCPASASGSCTAAGFPSEEYAPLQKQFNPVKFDAEQWVRIAKEAGMKYIVITSKHHDGFCLFDSKLTDYDMTGTPYGKDLLKPLADACHKEGIKICWYHSIMDWHHPDAKGDEFPKYVEHMRGPAQGTADQLRRHRRALVRRRVDRRVDRGAGRRTGEVPPRAAAEADRQQPRRQAEAGRPATSARPSSTSPPPACPAGTGKPA